MPVTLEWKFTKTGARFGRVQNVLASRGLANLGVMHSRSILQDTHTQKYIVKQAREKDREQGSEASAFHIFIWSMPAPQEPDLLNIFRLIIFL